MSDICVKTLGCKQLVISDNYDWGLIIPQDDVSRTIITLNYIPYKGIATTITVADENNYIETATVNPEDIGSSWTKINDGYYQINIKYFTDEDDVLTYTEVFNKCNLDCKIDSQIADYASNDECDSCNKDIEKDILNIALKSELLCYAITCSNKSKVWELYNYISNTLTQYNCKNC